MIKTVAELLEALRSQERKILDAEKITHPGTIGAMYEGLTADLLSMAMPPSLASIKVLSGFIESDDGELQSGQMDCMIVVGEGRPIPYTAEFVYKLEQVLVVVEVKKNSTKSQLLDAIDHLASISELLPEIMGPSRLSDESTGRLIGYRPYHADLTNIKRAKDRIIMDTAVTSAYLPLRIVFSYGGYKKANSIPKILTSFLSKDLNDESIVNFPDIVVDGDRVFLKTIGLPYAIPVRNGKWLWFAEIASNPFLAVLESIMWRVLPYMERAFPVFADHDENPTIKCVFGAQINSSKIGIFPCKGQLPADSQSYSELEHGVRIEEWEVNYLFYFQFSIRVPIDQCVKRSGQTKSVVMRSIGRFARLGLVFIDGEDLIANSTTMRLSIGPESQGHWVGEDCRGRFGRNSLKRSAHEDGSGSLTLHVTMASNYDLTPVSMADTVIYPGEEGKIDVLRYKSMKEAQKILEGGAT